jgi:DNA-binding NarL/FixJ family response regulator
MRVVLVDDSEFVREALATVVRAAGHEVVGQAAHGHDGVQRTVALRPDVVVTDWLMPVLDGIQATRQIRAAMPEVAVIAMTAVDDPEVADAFLAAGAAAFADKSDFRALQKALDEVQARRTVGLARPEPETTNPAVAGRSDEAL